MSRLRQILQKSRTTVGLQLALAMMVPAKGKAGTDVNPTPSNEESPDNFESQTAPPNLTGRWDFSRLFRVEAEPEIVGDVRQSAEQAQHIAHDAWRMTVKAAAKDKKHKASPANAVKDAGKQTANGKFVAKPMSFEEISLWLQSFNAGPYACLKYEGAVPYEETQNYVPRVMKYYEQDLSSEYDKYIDAAAAKYGLDPQMVRAIMKTESNFRNDTVSHAGARGLMQVMPVVWKDIKEKYDLEWEYSTGVFDPAKNVEVACAYLAWLRYDFLPRHFAAYESDPDAPVVLVRDKDRGVPDREEPRIVAKIGAHAVTQEVASADEDKVKKSITDAIEASEKSEKKSASDKSENEKDDADKESKSSRKKIEISDADSDKVVKKSSSNGKTKVVVRGGKGKAISLAVDGKGKVSSREKASKDRDKLEKEKKPAVAKATAAEREEKNQGG